MIQRAAIPTATLMFRTRDRTHSEAAFTSCDHAVVAAMERLSPRERLSAFICAGRVTLNHIEIATAYDRIVAA